MSGEWFYLTDITLDPDEFTLTPGNELCISITAADDDAFLSSFLIRQFEVQVELLSPTMNRFENGASTVSAEIRIIEDGMCVLAIAVALQ